MQNSTKISCEINTTNADVPLEIQIWLDNECIFVDKHVKGKQFFQHQMPDNDGEHVLEFVMCGKTTEHTKISESGQIEKDARLIIDNVSFDDIKLGNVFVELAKYTHNYNGTGLLTTEKFFGEMGCNGKLQLKFSTPIYLWLLENM